MGAAVRELQYALRRLRGSPMFTIAATLTMAIAIGATASVYGVVDGVLLRAFPYRGADRIMVLYESNLEESLPEFTVSPANYLDWQKQNTSFATLAASSATLGASEFEAQFTVAGAHEPERVRGLRVTPNYFSTLGIAPALGRSLALDSAGPAEVVISHGYWERRYGAAPSVIGQTITLDTLPYTIVGVMPTGLPGDLDLWTRLSFTGPEQFLRGHGLIVYGRLKPGATLDGARYELETIAGRLATAYPQSNRGWSVVVHPLLDELVGDVRSALVMLLSAAACVLLIGAANLANLFLVRCLAREREMAVRTAIGATRGRIAGELLVEAATLGLVAGALGVGVAVAGVRMLRALAPTTLPRLSEIGVDARVVAFCALTSIATVLIFGVLPAWQTSRGNLADLLMEGGRGTGSAQHHRLQDGLVVLQVAVALVLLTGAGLLVESFVHLRRMDPGFRPDGVLTAEIALRAERYPTPERQRAFIASILEQLTAQPGVDAASASSFLPVGDPPVMGFTIVGDRMPDPTHIPNTGFGSVSPDYFRTLGIKVRRGRALRPTDDLRSVKVVIVDDLLAHRFFVDRDPVGQRITFGGRDTMEIVGVVSTVKEGPLAVPDLPHAYVPVAQLPFPFLNAHVSVHTSGDLVAETRMLKQIVAGLDPTIPVSDVETMDDRLAQSIGTTRFSSFLASLFAVVALVLGMVGIYSVLAYIVSQRQREIAVRIALGASRSDVMGDVLRRALALTGVGVVLGTGAAWVLTRVLANLFLGVSPHDPAVFVGAPALFALVALAAASVPAFRTARVNPVVALTST